MAHDTRAEGASESAHALSAALTEVRAALSVLELAPLTRLRDEEAARLEQIGSRFPALHVRLRPLSLRLAAMRAAVEPVGAEELDGVVAAFDSAPFVSVDELPVAQAEDDADPEITAPVVAEDAPGAPEVTDPGFEQSAAPPELTDPELTEPLVELPAEPPIAELPVQALPEQPAVAEAPEEPAVAEAPEEAAEEPEEDVAEDDTEDSPSVPGAVAAAAVATVAAAATAAAAEEDAEDPDTDESPRQPEPRPAAEEPKVLHLDSVDALEQLLLEDLEDPGQAPGIEALAQATPVAPPAPEVDPEPTELFTREMLLDLLGEPAPAAPAAPAKPAPPPVDIGKSISDAIAQSLAELSGGPKPAAPKPAPAPPHPEEEEQERTMLMMDPGVMAALGRASGSPAQNPGVVPTSQGGSPRPPAAPSLNPGVVPAAAGGSPRPASPPLARVGLDDIGEEDVRVDQDLLIEDDERLDHPAPAARQAPAETPSRRAPDLGPAILPTIKDPRAARPVAAAIQLTPQGDALGVVGLDYLDEIRVPMESAGDEYELDDGDGDGFSIASLEMETEEVESEEAEVEQPRLQLGGDEPTSDDPDELNAASLRPVEEVDKAQLAALMKTAQDALEQGDLANAATAYTDLLDLKPDHVDAFLGRGRCWLDLGDYAAAMSDFQKAEDLDPNGPEPLVAMGELFFARKDYTRAIEFFDSAIEVDANHAMARCRRGISYYYKKSYREAFLDLQKAYTLDPDIPNIRKYVQMAIKKLERSGESA
ncbi:tetratricopeptide repeat protein [Myxococcota bacterium]|nr:tetratricopeptide repeat protein [Myxococcota bacterium]